MLFSDKMKKEFLDEYDPLLVKETEGRGRFKVGCMDESLTKEVDVWDAAFCSYLSVVSLFYCSFQTDLSCWLCVLHV